MKTLSWMIGVMLLASGCGTGPINIPIPGIETPRAGAATSPTVATSPSIPTARPTTSPPPGSPSPAAGSPTAVRTGSPVASPVLTGTVVATGTVRATGTVTTATASRTPTGTITVGDPQSVVDVTVNYVLQRTSITGFEVTVDAQTTEWARATVRQKSGTGNPSVVYLRRQASGWNVVSFGPAQPPDAQALGIPSTIIGSPAPASATNTPGATGTPGR